MDDPRRPPEAADAGDGTSRNPAVMVIILGVLIAGMLAVLLQNAGRYYSRTIPATPPPSTGAAVTAPAPHGDPDAPLRIEGALGDCVMWVADAVSAAVEPWPDKVSTRFISYFDEEGQEFVKAQGETLACICFNGEHEFTLKTADGRNREVRLVGPPGDGYTLLDLAAVLRQQWKAHCGAEPDGFSEALERLERAGAAESS